MTVALHQQGQQLSRIWKAVDPLGPDGLLRRAGIQILLGHKSEHGSERLALLVAWQLLPVCVTITVLSGG